MSNRDDGEQAPDGRLEDELRAAFAPVPAPSAFRARLKAELEQGDIARLENDLRALFAATPAPDSFRRQLRSDLARRADQLASRPPRSLAVPTLMRRPLRAMAEHPRATALATGILAAAAALLLALGLQGDLGPSAQLSSGALPKPPTPTPSPTLAATPTRAPRLVSIVPVATPVPMATTARPTPAPATATATPTLTPPPATPTRSAVATALANPRPRREGPFRLVRHPHHHEVTPTPVRMSEHHTRHATRNRPRRVVQLPRLPVAPPPAATIPIPPSPTAAPVDLPTATPTSMPSVPPTSVPATPVPPTQTSTPTSEPATPTTAPVPATSTAAPAPPTPAPTDSATATAVAPPTPTARIARPSPTATLSPPAQVIQSYIPPPHATSRPTPAPRRHKRHHRAPAPPTRSLRAHPRHQAAPARPTATVPARPTDTAVPSPTATPTLAPTATPAPSATATSTATPSPTPSATATPTDTATPTPPPPSPTATAHPILIPEDQPQFPVPNPGNAALSSPLAGTTLLTGTVGFSVPTNWLLPQVPPTLPVYALTSTLPTTADAYAIAQQIGASGLLMAPQPTGDGTVVTSVQVGADPYTMTVSGGSDGTSFTLESMYPLAGQTSAARLPALATAWLAAHGLAHPDLQLAATSDTGITYYAQDISGTTILETPAVQMSFDGGGVLRALRYSYLTLPPARQAPSRSAALAISAAVNQLQGLYSGPPLAALRGPLALSSASLAYAGVQGVAGDYLEPVYVLSGSVLAATGTQPFALYVSALE